MSGHSKWATTKHKKAKVDSQRAVVFQKFSREIIVASRLGGPDLKANFRSDGSSSTILSVSFHTSMIIRSVSRQV